jgi:hypothetical protein
MSHSAKAIESEANPFKRFCALGCELRDRPEESRSQPDVEVVYFVLSSSRTPLLSPLPPPSRYMKSSFQARTFRQQCIGCITETPK